MGLALLIGLLAAPPAAGAETEHEALQRIEAEFFAGRPSCSDSDPSCDAAPDPPRQPLGLRPPPALSTQGLWAPPALTSPLPVEPLAGFQVPVVLNGPVRAHLELFRTRGKYLYARWLGRLGRYRDMMRTVLTAEGVPPELMYVPLLESGMELEIVSPAGAAGPWQMVAPTAKSFGLRVDEWVDERLDPVKSSHAAARYLKNLYGQFGSWPLALAAYNAGPATVLDAIGRMHSNDYWALSAAGALPTETVRYVPRLFSAMIVGEAPHQNGFGDVMFEPPLQWREVAVPGGTSLADVARWGHVGADDLKGLNPQLRRGFTPPDGTDYALRVPSDASKRIEQAVAAHAADQPHRFVDHKMRFGERLRDIAADYGASRAELRRLNMLADEEPPPGRVLVIPDRGRRPPDHTNELLVALDPGVKIDPAGRVEVFFPVRYRQPLAGVARFFGVSAADVGMWNGIDPEADLQRGMVLRLFVRPDFDLGSAVLVPRSAVKFLRAGTAGAARSLRVASEERGPNVKRVTYTIRRGDSLGAIAARFGTTVDAVRAENGLEDDAMLSPGEQLDVPARRTPPRRRSHPERVASR